ncbi:hypothetical protein PMAYCL1PPCAC_29308 [Pristionchus mayeri]|uniref:F-box domain-containing protein n=1 Tax=Pristionchus mayeri TaxID=1317129 RepID=A0AAN5IAS2_9BILA|nr:hypothetical protein PMAYCL1PPCAC_29308 [Pristionchus mayeri]
MDQLPLELWEYIGLSCDVPTVRTLRKTCPIFASLLTDEFYKKKCKSTGVTLLPLQIHHILSSHPSLTLDFLTLYHFDPFGKNIGRQGSVSSSLLTPSSLSTHLDGKGRLHLDPILTLSPPRNQRGTLVYKLDLEEMGVPPWLMDVFRPRVSLTVHAYRMPLSDGDILVSAKLLRNAEEGSGAVCRKEHQGWFMAGWQASQRPVEESVQMEFEVYGEGARVLSIVASCSGGGRLAEIEVSPPPPSPPLPSLPLHNQSMKVNLHFGSEVPSDVEEQLVRWEKLADGGGKTEKEERGGEESEIIQVLLLPSVVHIEMSKRLHQSFINFLLF